MFYTGMVKIFSYTYLCGWIQPQVIYYDYYVDLLQHRCSNKVLLAYYYYCQDGRVAGRLSSLPYTKFNNAALVRFESCVTYECFQRN